MDEATDLEAFITNLQRERAAVAYHIFTYGNQTNPAYNLSERFSITDDALERLPWPKIFMGKTGPKSKNMLKSKLRFQIRHGDFRKRISQVSISHL